MLKNLKKGTVSKSLGLYSFTIKLDINHCTEFWHSAISGIKNYPSPNQMWAITQVSSFYLNVTRCYKHLTLRAHVDYYFSS